MVKIYLIFNSVNGKMYVGKTSQKLARRWSHHVSHAPQNDYHFHRAICKYGKEAFSIQEIGTAPSHKEADKLERLWIILLRTFYPNFGYNGTFGGDGVSLTEVTKKKLSVAMTGLPRPQSARDKLSVLYMGEGNPMYGRIASAETRAKMSASHAGVKRSPEFCQKMRDRALGPNNPLKGRGHKKVVEPELVAA